MFSISNPVQGRYTSSKLEQNQELCIDRHRESNSVRPALFSGSITKLLDSPASQIDLPRRLALDCHPACRQRTS